MKHTDISILFTGLVAAALVMMGAAGTSTAFSADFALGAESQFNAGCVDDDYLAADSSSSRVHLVAPLEDTRDTSATLDSSIMGGYDGFYPSSGSSSSSSDLRTDNRCAGSPPITTGDSPTVTITTSASMITVNSPVTLEATASDTEDGTLDASGVVWSIGNNQIGQGASVMWTPDTAGMFEITATIRDGDNNPGYANYHITVSRGDPPMVKIGSDTPATATVNSPVTLEATASDTEDGTLDASGVVWSIGNNQIGQGASVMWTPPTSGVFEITATITDSDDNPGYAKHTLTVGRGDPPAITITTPLTSAKINEPLLLTANVSDNDDDILDASGVVWSVGNTRIGEGASVTWVPSNPGERVITATITDRNGNSVSDTLTITVDRGDPPTIEIGLDTPTRTPINSPVTFMATANDTEDGSLNNNVEWSSDPAGLTDTGASVTWEPTAPGTFEITASVTDSDGNTITDTHTIAVDRGDPPTINIASDAPIEATINSPVTLEATATDSKDGSLSNDVVWSSDPAGLTDTGASVTWEPTAPGTFEITASVTDSDGNTVIDTHTIAVDRGDPPTITIDASTVTTATVNSPVTLEATVNDNDDSTLDAGGVEWSSDPAGLTDTGASVSWEPTAPGTYEIIATITDRNGNTVTDTHTITVDRGDPPTINIASNTATTATVNSPVTLAATASDTEDGTLNNNVEWSSEPADLNKRGASVSWTPPELGVYVITASITDSDGNTITDTHTITIDRGNPPTINIDSRAPTTAIINSPVTLEVDAKDPEEGDLGANVVWSSEPAGLADTGSSVSWIPTTDGTFVITASVTDRDDNTVTDTHTITVDRGNPPTVEISSNVPDKVQVNSAVTLAATASDTEEGDLGANVVWSSDPAELTGTGANVVWTPTKTGTYVITATIIDNAGNSDRDTHTITVDRGDPPTINIASNTVTTATVNSPVTLAATASDTEDGTLSANVVWRYDANLIGTGASVSWTPTTAGTFVITANVTDSDGNSVVDTHRIAVDAGSVSQTQMKNSLYNQPPTSSDTFATKIILAHQSPITSDSAYNTLIRGAMDTSVEMWEKSNTQLEFETKSRPLNETAYEYSTQATSIVNLHFEETLPADRVGYYDTRYYETPSGPDFIYHNIYIQMGWNDCNDNYQRFHPDAIADTLEHEIGHYLRLGHTNERGHLMWSPYNDAVPLSEFDTLGWNIPSDTSYDQPRTINGRLLDRQMDKLSSELVDLRKEHADLNKEYQRLQDLLAVTPKSPALEYNKLVAMINKLVDEMNSLVSQINSRADAYNLLVPQFNCIEAPPPSP